MPAREPKPCREFRNGTTRGQEFIEQATIEKCPKCRAVLTYL